ncbi:hypothetical protein evm_004509, partial [Chilo suppressalis]
MQELPGQREGTKKYCHNGYFYHVDPRSADIKNAFICSYRYRQWQCPVTARKNLTGDIHVKGEHGHSQTSLQEYKRFEEFKIKLKERACKSTDSPETIFKALKIDYRYRQWQFPVTARKNLTGDIHVKGEHGHSQTSLQEYKRFEEFKMKLKERACKSTDSPETIFKALKIEYSDVAHLIQQRSAKMHIRRERNKYQPKVPKIFNDLSNLLVKYEPAQRIYQGQVVISETCSAVIFASNAVLERMNDCREIYVDGTFKCVPKKIGAKSLWGSPTRTNNICESFHRWLTQRLGSHPNFYVFIDKLTNVIAGIEEKWQDLQRDGCAFGTKSFKQLKIDLYINNQQIALHNGRIDVGEFLMKMKTRTVKDFIEFKLYSPH